MKKEVAQEKEKGEEMEGTSTAVPFKNLHSREYQGHKKKVLSLSLTLSSLIFNFRFCSFFFHWGNPREEEEEGIDDLIGFE